MVPNFEIFGKVISPYMLTALAGILTAGGLGFRISKKRGILDADMLIVMLVSAVGVLLGGHLLYGITSVIRNWELMPLVLEEINSIDDFLLTVRMIFGGSVFFGGLLGGIAVGVIFMKIKKLNIGAYTDVMALVVPLFHFFGRLGCFLSGCCYGAEWKHGYVYRHSQIEAANGVPRFPVQLLEAAFILALFVLLLIWFNSEKFKYRLFYIYLAVYSAGRFFLELLRGDESRGIYFGFSTSQYISVFVLIFALLLFLKPKNAKKEENNS